MRADNLTASHRTGLAKLPSVVEWLTHALAHSPSAEAAPKFLIFAHHRSGAPTPFCNDYFMIFSSVACISFTRPMPDVLKFHAIPLFCIYIRIC